MSNLKKTVLITGCSAGGIGSELAKEYHAQGLHVIATARRLSSMDALRELGIECLELDVTKVDNIKQVRDYVANTFGTLDILVNNAGRTYAIPATDVDINEVKAVFEINVFAVFAMVKEFVNLLIASGNGRIVNIGSVAGIFPFAFGSTYNASKAALHAYGNTLRIELEPFNVKVITIVTGGVKSNIAASICELNPESLYYEMNDDFIEKRINRSQQGAVATDVYARSVVAATLKASPKAWVWKGNFAWATWFIDSFFPRSIWDVIVSKKFGLGAFKQRLLSKKKTA